MAEKIVSVDQKEYKWSGKSILKNLDALGAFYI